MSSRRSPLDPYGKAYPHGAPWITRAEQQKYHQLVKKLRAKRDQNPPASRPAVRDEPDNR